MSQGLRALGVPHQITDAAVRRGGLAILLGTSRWRALETADYLLVDRASVGDPVFVQLVRNGHGRRGDHRVPANAPASRWEWLEDYAGVRVWPWRDERRVVLCGQHEAYCDVDLDGWCRQMAPHATHFRRHPHGRNPTALPELRGWDKVGRAITLNSSVAVEAVLAGIPTVTMDEGAMAWDVTAHDPRETAKPARLPWLHWLAWTQWNYDELSEGRPWAHLL